MNKDEKIKEKSRKNEKMNKAEEVIISRWKGK